MNAQAWLTLIIAVGGCLGTIALMILNMRVQLAMTQLQADIAKDMGKLHLEIANLRTESADERAKASSERANLFEKLIDYFSKLYMSRDTQLEMHRANQQRLDELRDELGRLSQRVNELA